MVSGIQSKNGGGWGRGVFPNVFMKNTNVGSLGKPIVTNRKKNAQSTFLTRAVALGTYGTAAGAFGLILAPTRVFTVGLRDTACIP